MNGKVSLRDYETVSAYLDGALDIQERARLEKRLQVEKPLKQELEALKRTRTVLRSQARMRAPRNFTLTPQMAGVRQPARYSMGAYPALRLASVLATIFLALVVAGDLIGSSMKPQMIAASDLPQQAPLAMPGFEMGGRGGGSDVNAEPVKSAEEVALEDPEIQPATAMRAMPEAEAVLQAEPPIVAEEASSVDEAPAASEGSSDEMNDMTVEVVETEAPRQTTWPFVRVLQILLAVLAIGTGLGALILRRVSRS
jgi:hypothetical protein